MDFTLQKYEELLKSIETNKYKVYGIYEWVKQNPKTGILIRHDVDRSAANSLEVAKLENKYGFKTTYYFRITSHSFKPEIIKAIKNLGHEIGYHYEDLALAKGDYEKAIELFQKHLKKFEGLANIKTVAMHGSPLSKSNNRDIWNKYDFKEYGIEAEGFTSIDYSDIYYVTDTGRSWSNNSINLRDKVNSLKIDVSSTEDLIRFLEKKPEKIAIVTHPERWNNLGINYLYSFSLDMAANSAKWVIKNTYNKLK